MGLYQHIREAWKKPKETLGELWRERLIAWRQEDSTVKLEHPTRLDRARALGYKAKQGYIVVRQKVRRGGHRREAFSGGRRSRNFGQSMSLHQNYQHIAEVRAQRKFLNLAVLNSYWVAQDGTYYWFENVMVDPTHPVIKSDPHINWICDQKHRTRVYHGKTSAAKRFLARHRKGRGVEKARPSRRAKHRRL